MFINTVNDSTLAFNFTRILFRFMRSHWQLSTCWQWRCVWIDWADNDSLTVSYTLKPDWQEWDVMAGWPTADKTNFKLVTWSKHSLQQSYRKYPVEQENNTGVGALKQWPCFYPSCDRSSHGNRVLQLSVVPNLSTHTHKAIYQWTKPGIPCSVRCWWWVSMLLLWVRAIVGWSSGLEVL